MNSPGVKRPLPSSDDGGSKRKCSTPSIMNFFSPKPKVVNSQTSSQATNNQSSISSPTQAKPPTPSISPTRSTPPKSMPRTPVAYSPRTTFKASSPSVKPLQPQSQNCDESSLVKVNHAHLNYKFLQPEYRRDINMRRPDDPDYDEKTLYVPPEFLKKETPAMRQWWSIKQRNMDAVLFFKMGKFYELFNEDAVIGVNNLNLMFMKSNEDKPAHAGFPESSFTKYADKLIEKGFKVMRIEQTETPAMLEERVQATGKCDRVVKREVCQVTTKGTRLFGISETIFHSAQNQYLLAISESTVDSSETGKKSKVFGVCFVDVTIGTIYIGQFTDDNNLSDLNILFAHHTPTEVLYEKGSLSSDAMKCILKTGARLEPLKFWPLKKTLIHIKVNRVFSGESNDFEWPPFMKSLFVEGETSSDLMNLEPRDEYKLALNSFGAIVYYLDSQFIEKQVLACANFEFYISPLSQQAGQPHGPFNTVPPMVMDHVALRNLEIFTNSSGCAKSTLFEKINDCKTHFGQRLLKNWICSPLCDVKQIESRLDAVEALISNNNASLMNEIVHMLSQTPDLERYLSKIKNHCFKSESDTRAVMFDGNQYNKAKVNAFVNLLNNFRRLQKFINSINGAVKGSNSKVLCRLLSFTTDGGLYPEYSATLDYFENSFDFKAAQKTGQIIPSPGVNKEFDECEANIKDMKEKLDDYLLEQQSRLGCQSLEYFGSAKNRYQLQVPEKYIKKVPDDWRIESGRKGFKRYYTPAIDKLFAKLTTYEEQMKRILDSVLADIFGQFLRKAKLWSAAIECVAIVDVIQSIAKFARSLMANGVDMCRPTFVQNEDPPILEYKNGRHPVLVKIDSNYISNDLILDDRTILLSGANMGGKSTLMRQTALLVVLAQVGCFVPASSFKLTPVDRIFSRLGASDRLLEGESTFYTELVETSAMLHCATRRSLLLLDELGRGTSTFDGTAIAYSVIEEISKNLKCRCLFSTHYHTLTRDFMNREEVRLAHMACKIERDGDEDGIDLDPLKENITFLYKITDGPAARSYGYNVAKLAGISDSIITEAFSKSKEIELSCKVLGSLQNICRQQTELSSDLKQAVLSSLRA
uniref:DNA mismatch repair protein n=1 Tax=Aceria tosichella TaxID=561515 RepID=A0A6G1SF33_9ACAR